MIVGELFYTLGIKADDIRKVEAELKRLEGKFNKGRSIAVKAIGGGDARAEAAKTATSLEKLRERFVALRAEWGQDQRAAGSVVKSLERIEKSLLKEAAAAKEAGRSTTSINSQLVQVAEQRIQIENKLEAVRQSSGRSARKEIRSTLEQAAALTQGGRAVADMSSRLTRLKTSYDTNQAGIQTFINGLQRMDAQLAHDISQVNENTKAHDRLSKQRSTVVGLLAKAEKDLARATATSGKSASDSTKAMVEHAKSLGNAGTATGQLQGRLKDLKGAWDNNERSAKSYLASLERLRVGAVKLRDANAAAGKSTSQQSALLSQITNAQISTEKKLSAARQVAGKSQRDANKATLETIRATSEAVKGKQSLTGRLTRLEDQWKSNQISAKNYGTSLRRIVLDTEKEIAAVAKDTQANQMLTRVRSQAATRGAALQNNLRKATDATGVAVSNLTKAELQNARAITPVASATERFRRELTVVSAQISPFNKNLGGTLRQLKGMERAIDATEREWAQMGISVDKSSKAYVEFKRVQGQVRGRIDQTKLQMLGLSGALRNSLSLSENLAKAWLIGLGPQGYRLFLVSDVLRQSFQSLAGSFKLAQGVVGALTISLTALGTVAALVVGAGIIGAAAAAIKLDEAFTDVIKTTNFTSSEMLQLFGRFAELTRQVPLTTVEFLEFARVAGQLGIRGVQNVALFSEAIGELSVATDIAGEEGAQQLARFLQATGTNAESLGRTAVQISNVLNELENSTAASAGQILRVTEFTQALATQSKFTRTEILALNSTLVSLGLTAESGGSAIVRIFADIQASVAKGGSELANFAQVTGVTQDTFKRLVQNNPADALELLVTALGKAREGGEDLNGVITALGIVETRERRAILSLAGGYQQLTKNRRTALREAIRQTSIDAEVGRRSETLASQLKIIRTEIGLLAQSFGIRATPALRSFLSIVREFTRPFAEAARNMIAARNAAINLTASTDQLTESLRITAGATGGLLDATSVNGLLGAVAELANTMSTKGKAALAQFALSAEFAELAENDLQLAVGETMKLYLAEQILHFQTSQSKIADLREETRVRRQELRKGIQDSLSHSRALTTGLGAIIVEGTALAFSAGQSEAGSRFVEGRHQAALAEQRILLTQLQELTAAEAEADAQAQVNAATLKLYEGILADLTAGTITWAEASELLGDRFGLIKDAFDFGDIEDPGKKKRTPADVLKELEDELVALERRGTILELDPDDTLAAQVQQFEQALTELTGAELKLEVDDSRVQGLIERLAEARAELDILQKEKIFQDLAEEGTEAVQEAARQGNTLASTIDSIETRTGLLNEALAAISDMEAFGPQSAEADFLRGRLAELQVELNKILELQTEIEAAQERQRSASDRRFDEAGQAAFTQQAFIQGGQPLEDLPEIQEQFAQLEIALAEAAEETMRWGDANDVASAQADVMKAAIQGMEDILGVNHILIVGLKKRYDALVASVEKASRATKKAKVDFDPGGVIHDLSLELEQAATEARIFGDRFALAGTQAQLVKAAIVELIRGGLDPQDERIQDLIADYDILSARAQNFTEILDKGREAVQRQEQVQAVLDSLNIDLERAGILAATFGDSQSLAATQAGILRSGIESLLDQGLNPLGTEIRERVAEYAELDKIARLFTASLEKQAAAATAAAEALSRRKGRQLEEKPLSQAERLAAQAQADRLAAAALGDAARTTPEALEARTAQALTITGSVDPRLQVALEQLDEDLQTAAEAADMFNEQNKLAGVQAGILRAAIEQLRDDGFVGAADAIEDLLPDYEALIEAQERLAAAADKTNDKIDVGKILDELGADLQNAADSAALFGEEEELAGVQANLFRQVIQTLEPVLGKNSTIVQDLAMKWGVYAAAAEFAGRETDDLVDELLDASAAILGLNNADLELDNLINQLRLLAATAEQEGDFGLASLANARADALELNRELETTVEVLNFAVDLFKSIASIDFSNAKSAIAGLADVASGIASMFGPTGQIIAAGIQVFSVFAQGFAEAFDLAFTSAEQRIARFAEDTAKNMAILTEETIKALTVTTEETRWIFPFGPVTGTKIDEFATQLRLAIAESVASGLADAMTTGINAALRGDKDWKKQLEEGVKATLRNAIIQAFVEATIVAAGVQEFVAEFAKLIAQGQFEEAGKLARDELPSLVADLLRGIEILLGNLPPELFPDTGGAGTGSGDTPGSPFTPDSGTTFSLPTASPTIITATPAWVDDLGRLLDTHFTRFGASIDRLVDEGITINVNTGGGGTTSGGSARSVNIIRT